MGTRQAALPGGDAVATGLLEAGSGRRVGAGLRYHLGSALWHVLFQDLSSSPGEDKAPLPPLSARCQLSSLPAASRANRSSGCCRRCAQPAGQGRPSSPVGPRRVLSLTSGGVCGCAGVCECGRGRGPSKLLHPSVLLGTH